ncbi:hypothetical protein Tco_0862787 [Tanacetum coccineum]
MMPSHILVTPSLLDPDGVKHYGLIGHTIERCYEFNGYPASFKRNPNLLKQLSVVKRFNGSFDVSQFASTSSSSMSSSFTNEQMMKLLSLINEKHATNVSGDMAGHPNGTLAKITTIGSLRLTSDVVLFDILVVPEYNDLNLAKIMGTGSESGGLYMFDCVGNGKSNIGLCNSSFVCHVSKDLWHCKLGHPVNQVLSVIGDVDKI